MPKEAVLNQLGTQESSPLHLRAAGLYKSEGDAAKAATHLRRAIKLFPYYTGEGNAYEALADILEKEGDRASAAQALELLVGLDENNLKALKRLADLRLAEGDQARALEALQLSFYVSPFDYGAHAARPNCIWRATMRAVRSKSFERALGLQPPNEAEANYNVARAPPRVGNMVEAKRSVLRALEAAPSYEKGQELPSKIVGQ